MADSNNSPSPRQDINAAMAVTSFLLSGAFVLQALGIQPLLTETYIVLFGKLPPDYFTFAIGAAGIFGVVYQLFYVMFMSPLYCFTGVLLWNDRTVDIGTFELSDIPTLFAIYVIYQWAIVHEGITAGSAVGEVYLGGFLVIITSMVFRLVPRIVANHVRRDCWYSIRIVLIAIPLSILTFLPTMYIMQYLTGAPA